MAKLDPFRSPQARDDFIAKYDAVVADWPVDCEERDLEIEFGATHVIVSGSESAPPLVLLHGAAATAVMWRPVIEALSATYRCYCVDTIIEGNKSVASRRILGKTKLVTWLRQVFAALDIEQARVVGLSYGGWLAANLAVPTPRCWWCRARSASNSLDELAAAVQGQARHAVLQRARPSRCRSPSRTGRRRPAPTSSGAVARRRRRR